MKKNANLLVIFGCALLLACSQNTSKDEKAVTAPYVPPEIPKFEPVVNPGVQNYDPVIQNEPPPPPKAKQQEVETTDMQGTEDTKMDILFVIDSSQSMCSDQERLSRNIDKFVNIFANNNRIDWHIGVTTVWDSSRYLNAERTYKNGELRKVVGQKNSVRFVSRTTPNALASLRETLKVGLDKLTSDPRTTGPENEEVFSPILAAFEPEMKSGPNRGFRREDAHLAIVIITDTDDSSPGLVAETVASRLSREVSENTKVTVAAALGRYDEMIQYKSQQEPGYTTFQSKFNNGILAVCDSYTVDPMLVPPLRGPEQIASLVSILRGEAFDLSKKDYGADLAKIGQGFVKRSLSYKIPLKKFPDPSEYAKMSVRINGKIVPKDEVKGWSYDADDNVLIINEGYNLDFADEFKVVIRYTPL